MRTRSRRRSFGRRRSRRTRWSLALVFALVFAPAGARPARAACVEFSDLPAISATGDLPVSVVAADLDGDGDLDAVAAFGEDDEIVWFANDGAGGGWAKTTISNTVGSPAAVEAADLDRDGDLDVVSASLFGNQLSWFENDGTGSTWSQHSISTGSAKLAVADADGDGDLDLASLEHGTGVIRWHQNDGEGGGWAVHTIRTGVGGAIGTLEFGDIDGDGDPDLVSTNGQTDELAWLSNNGIGGGWAITTISSSADLVNSVALADVDRDGNLDVFGTGATKAELVWYENSHAGGSGATWTARPIFSGLVSAFPLRAADLDRDGDVDLLSGDFFIDGLRWYENDGAGAAWTAHTISSVPTDLTDLASADLDGDGDLDVLSVSGADDSVAWHRNDRLHGEALFDDQPPLWSPTITSDWMPVAAGDLNGDAIPEVVAGRSGADHFWLFHDDGVGDDWIPTEIATGLSIIDLVLADIDGDGDLDAVASTSNAGVFWFRNNGGAGGWTRMTVSATLAAHSLAAADLDRDGDLDLLAVLDSGSPGAYWFENTGLGWTQHTIFEGSLGFAAVADFDRDGDLDVLSGATTEAYRWHENDGQGEGWITRTLFANTFIFPKSGVAADVDSDGDLDVVGCQGNAFAAQQIAWYENDGTPAEGTWAFHEISFPHSNCRAVVAADLDGDGDLDALATDAGTDTLAWFENGGLGTTWTPRELTPGIDLAEDLAVANFDRDGDLDVVVTGRGGSELIWFENLGSGIFDDGFDSDGDRTCWSSSAP